MDTEVEDGITAQQIYKMAARREDLAMLQQQVSDSGRRLSFIEYAVSAILYLKQLLQLFFVILTDYERIALHRMNIFSLTIKLS